MIENELTTVMRQSRMQPFLKWAGGKRWLVSKGVPVPLQYRRLVEPFMGSAAVFFSINPARALLADVNEELVNLFTMMKCKPDKVEALMRQHHEAHCSEHFYKVRAFDGGDDVSRAARMLYLNRTCWNGLYRVNKLGKFNVPIGTKSMVLGEFESFRKYAAALQNAAIKCQDFEQTVNECGEGDFVFVDPPYTVKHNMNGFVKYNENIFSWEDQVRLAKALRKAAARGASILVTNADHESLIDLYSPDFKYSSLVRHSVLAGSAAFRGSTTEALFSINL